MRAAFSNTRSGAASSTRPMRFARRASIAFPVNSMSSAAVGPTSFGSHCTPCHAGTMPSITSGSAKRVDLTDPVAFNAAVEARIIVTYQQDAGTGLWVPARMEERYRRPRDASEVHGVATYSKFRRFSVSTSEEVATDDVAK